MCYPLVIGAVIAVASSVMQYVGQQQQARAAASSRAAALRYQAQVQQNNAEIAEYQAQDAERRGEIEQQRLFAAREQATGTQRAALAAAGLDIQSGSALSTVVDTAGVTREDAVTIRDNAAREAWMARVQGASSSAESGLLLQSANRSRVSPYTGFDTLLTGATNAYSRFAQWQGASALAS